MIGVNLIPPELLARDALKRRIRRWLAVLVLVGGTASVPFVIEGRQRVQVGRLTLKVADVDRRLSRVRKRVAVTAQAVLDLDAELARARALRTKRSWAGLLALVSNCMPPEAWLTSVGTDPAQPGGQSRVTPAAAHQRGVSQEARGAEALQETERPAAAVLLDAPTRMRLQGFALDHDGLYDLMTGLKESGSFSAVELVKAGVEPVLQGNAVHFVVTCEW